MAILICSCVAFAGVTDIVANAFGLVISGLANAVLGLADYVIEPLFTITRMNTVQIVSYLPGFNDADGSVGSFFSQAIAAIAYMIAGTLIICRIITYFVDLANGEKLEPISRLIWNAIFGIILTVAGKSLLTLFFNRIIAPLSGALVDGMIGEGGVFSFATTGKMIANLGDATETYQITELPKLLVVVFLMLLIAWNLIKLALECAERYIICIVTIMLSPLAFSTAVTEGTKQTAKNWFESFWAQSVLLILNIWVVGVAKTTLANDMSGKSVNEFVTWALLTYAYLKIAQRLDDMMQTAGLKVTRTGMDIGRDIVGAAKTTVDAAGTAYRGGKWLGKEVAKGGKFIAGKAVDFGGNVIEFGGKTKNAITNAVNEKKAEVAGGKPEGYTPNNAESTATNRELREKQSETHKQNGRVSIAQKDTQAWQDATTPKEQEKALKKLNENNSNKTGVANMLADQNIVPKGTKVKGFSSENGKLYANTYKKDNAGGIHRSKVELKSEGGQLRAVGASSKLDVSPDGKSATLKTEKGTYKLTQKDSDRRDGKELWEATKVKDENDADILKENQIPQQFLTSKNDADNDDDSSAKAAAATFTDDKNGELSVEGMLNEKMKENEPLYELNDDGYDDAIESKTPSAEDSESTLSEEAAHTNEGETNISIVPDDIDDKLALLDSDTSEVQKQDMASVQTNDGNLLSGRNSIDDLYEDDVKATSSAIDEFSNASSEQEQAKAIAELNSQSGLDGAQHSLSKTNAIPQDSAVESITADGNQLHANAVKRDDTGTTIMSVGIAKGESGIVATGDTSTTKISPTGESVSFTNGKGTFELRQTGIDEETGNASWEAIQTKGADGSNIPEPARTTQSFQVDNVAGQNDEQAAAAATEAFSKGSNDTPSIQDTLVSNTQAATEKTRQEGVAAVQQYKAVTASTPETTQSTGSSATPTIQSITPEEKEQASVNLNTVNVRAGIQQDLADQGAIDKDEKVSSVRAEEGKVYATMTKEVDGNMVAREVEIDTNNGKLSVGKETYKARTLSDGATVVRSEAGEFYANREGDTVTVARVKDASGERVKENDGGNTFTFTHDSNKNETQEIGEKSHQIIASGAAAMETGDASGGGTAVTEHQLETMGAQTTQSQNRTPQAGVPASAKSQSQEKVKAPSATDKRHINTSSASSDWKKKQIDAHGSDTRETKKKTDSSEQ